MSLAAHYAPVLPRGQPCAAIAYPPLRWSGALAGAMVLGLAVIACLMTVWFGTRRGVAPLFLVPPPTAQRQSVRPQLAQLQELQFSSAPLCGPGLVPDGRGGCVADASGTLMSDAVNQGQTGGTCGPEEIPDGWGGCLKIGVENTAVCPPGLVVDKHGKCVRLDNLDAGSRQNGNAECGPGLVPDGLGGCVTPGDTDDQNDQGPPDEVKDAMCGPGLIPDGNGGCQPECGPGLKPDGAGGCISKDSGARGPPDEVKDAMCGPGLIPDGNGGCQPECGRDLKPDGAGGCISKDTNTTQPPPPDCGGGLVLKGRRCVPPDKQKNLSFYMYRAQSDVDYVLENVNAASLAGVMWYLENEVIRPTCPRHYAITRIIRVRVTIRPPNHLPHSFGKFFAFDKGQCTAPDCADFFRKFGYPVGCQRQVDTIYSPNPVWYSLPGACPLIDLPAKNPGCLQDEPGGRCASPTGQRTCTWTYENAGELSIAELEGIPDYIGFCASGGNELALGFWEGQGDKLRSAQRVEQAKRLFEERYPQYESLPDPLCDWT